MDDTVSPKPRKCASPTALPLRQSFGRQPIVKFSGDSNGGIDPAILSKKNIREAPSSVCGIDQQNLLVLRQVRAKINQRYIQCSSVKFEPQSKSGLLGARRLSYLNEVTRRSRCCASLIGVNHNDRDERLVESNHDLKKKPE